MTPWLTVIGAGEGEVPPIPPGHVVLGPSRLKAKLPDLVEWRTPALDAMLAQIEELRGTPTVVLASGDPMWFGIGATLARHLAPEEFRVLPGPSSFQLAAARLHWPLQQITTLSLHGRPVAGVHPHILPGNRILALTSDRRTAAEVAALLVARRYGRTRMTILEHLGAPADGAADQDAPRERIITTTATGFAPIIGDFYVLALECIPDATAPLLPQIPGLPDEAFVHDGQLTKREVRAMTLARLAPYPGALLWDVGAGCGSVGIEWMRATRDARAIAFERDAGRLAMIAQNAHALGTPRLGIVPGELPASLANQPPPDAVFIGGDVGNHLLFEACWAALRPGGRLVANAVTLDGEQALYARQARLGGELTRIDISVLDAIGGHRALRPRMAVTQYQVTRP